MRQEDGSALTCRWQLRPSYNTWYGLGYIHIDVVHVRLHSLMQVPEPTASGGSGGETPKLEEPDGPSSSLRGDRGLPSPAGTRGGNEHAPAGPDPRWMADVPVCDTKSHSTSDVTDWRNGM